MMKPLLKAQSIIAPPIIALCCLVLAGCTQVGARIANLESYFSDTRVMRDIDFSAGTNLKLDIYLPEQSGAHSLPVVVFFYGGRWSFGSKDDYRFAGEALAHKGFITVIADYRKYPEVTFPLFVNDGAQAVAWTLHNIADHGGDPDAIFVAGHSSGAHIGALLIADERYLMKEGVDPVRLKGFSGLAGPYDFEPQADDLKKIFGPPERYPEMQVTQFISGNEPPMQLMWGNQDEAVWRRNLDRLEQRIEQKNGHVETVIYNDMDHVDIVAALTWFYRQRRPVLEDMSRFFQQQLQP